MLLGCDGIAECCVIGAPDEHWGEIIAGVFVVRASGTNLSEEHVLQFGPTGLPDYKRPRKVISVDGSLPVNSGGKVDRRALRETLWGKQQRRI